MLAATVLQQPHLGVAEGVLALVVSRGSSPRAGRRPTIGTARSIATWSVPGQDRELP